MVAPCRNVLFRVAVCRSPSRAHPGGRGRTGAGALERTRQQKRRSRRPTITPAGARLTAAAERRSGCIWVVGADDRLRRDGHRPRHRWCPFCPHARKRIGTSGKSGNSRDVLASHEGLVLHADALRQTGEFETDATRSSRWAGASSLHLPGDHHAVAARHTAPPSPHLRQCRRTRECATSEGQFSVESVPGSSEIDTRHRGQSTGASVKSESGIQFRSSAAHGATPTGVRASSWRMRVVGFSGRRSRRRR